MVVINMNSIGEECNKLKHEYDACFNKWFAEKFLKGETNDECFSLFRKYQDCVKKAVEAQKIDLWELEKDVLGTEQEQKPNSKKRNDGKT
ncbi:uncharacterized protein LOC143239706 isoform X1 [Tachypleus tridentatus]|uniref:uncharacterized protein LOC143239706 isoform X1 n=1 Tax=Tachypleus tridentatus TaxID=6853 RepID=UPI003FCF78AC